MPKYQMEWVDRYSGEQFEDVWSVLAPNAMSDSGGGVLPWEDFEIFKAMEREGNRRHCRADIDMEGDPIEDIFTIIDA